MANNEFIPRHGLVVPANTRFVVPTGNTGQRPLTPTVGDWRFNTDFQCFEGFYANGSWAALAAFAGDPNDGVYANTLSVGANSGFFRVYMNSSSISVGANVIINTSSILVGNSTVNATMNSSVLQVGPNMVVNTTYLGIGNSTVNVLVNSTSVAIGSNVVITSTGANYGNSTIYANSTPISFKVVSGAANAALISTGLSINGGNTIVNADGVFIGTGPTQATADYWQPFVTISANTTANNRSSITADTSLAPIYVTLPTTPANGNGVRVRRSGANNSLFIKRSDRTIGGFAEDFEVDVNLVQTELKFDSSANTWMIWINGVASGGPPALSNNVTLASALNYNVPVTIGVSSTPAIGAANSNIIFMTGVGTITGFDTIAAGATREIQHQGSQVITYNPTSMITVGTKNISVVAGDVTTWTSLGSGNWKMTDYIPIKPSIDSNFLFCAALLF